MAKRLINFVANGEGLGIVDALYAYMQSKNVDYDAEFELTITPLDSREPLDPRADLNILFEYMPDRARDTSAYDIVIYSNGCEPLTVSTSTIRQGIDQPNTFFHCNAFTNSDHAWHHKLIWFPANIMTMQNLWCRHLHAMFFENHLSRENLDRDNVMVFINGRNDSWRHHVGRLLADKCPAVTQKSTISSIIHETNDSFFESLEDSVFRQWINDQYPLQRNFRVGYYDNMVSIGLGQKFGKWPPGYRILPEYFQYRCVIFPESTWQNDEVALTEKLLKCVHAGALPWPVGGSNVNLLYNRMGFRTAWNLLPPEMQAFDSKKDHRLRHDLMTDAMAWLYNNAHVLTGPEAKQMILQNSINFLHSSLVIDPVIRFYQIITQAISRRT